MSFFDVLLHASVSYSLWRKLSKSYFHMCWAWSWSSESIPHYTDNQKINHLMVIPDPVMSFLSNFIPAISLKVIYNLYMSFKIELNPNNPGCSDLWWCQISRFSRLLHVISVNISADLIPFINDAHYPMISVVSERGKWRSSEMKRSTRSRALVNGKGMQQTLPNEPDIGPSGFLNSR